MELLILLLAIIFIGSFYFYVRHIMPIRPKESGFEYVNVNLDGTVRELFSEEIEVLNEENIWIDNGGRPQIYIKSRYSQLTSDGKISGFIKRNRVPKKNEIKK